MSAVATYLADLAAHIALGYQHQAADLQRQIAEIDERKAQLLMEREIARRARERFPNYRVQIGFDYQCPYCWLSRGAHGSLQTLGSGNGAGRTDTFRCRSCEQIFATPFNDSEQTH
jgi:hypothetical protein